MFILDINDKDQTTCPVASSIQLMTLTYSKPDSLSLSKNSENVTAEDGKDNTTLPATSMKNREITCVTASSGKAEREVNDIMGIKRRQPIALIWVILRGHTDSEELSKDKNLNFQNLRHCPFLVCTLKSVHQKDKETMTLCFLATLTNMFISVDILDKFWPDTPLEFAAMGYYGMALHKTVPENRNTVTRLDREEDEISTTLGRSANEKNYAKELNRLSLQQKDTEFGTFFNFGNIILHKESCQTPS